MKAGKLIPALVAALIFSSAAWAQDTQPQTQPPSGGAGTPIQPISTSVNSSTVPVARGSLAAYAPDNGNGVTETAPDGRFLTGVETLSVGMLRSFTTLVDPSLFVTESVDNGLTPGQWDTGTTVGGTLGLLRDWNRSRIAFQYVGSQSFYQPSNEFNGGYHDFSVAQTNTWGRWGLLFRDDLLYNRTSDFAGFLGGGAAPASGIASSSSLQPGLAPAQSIATGADGSLSDTGVAQASYQLSHRSAITFAGSYGLLHYTEGGYIDSDTVTGTAGYNYAISRMNSFAISYSYAQNIFVGSTGKTTTNTALASFGRKITGRLALQAGAGPQYQVVQGGVGLMSGNQISWTANGSLNYVAPSKRISYNLGYSHGLTGRSGVFYGAENDTVTGGMQIGTGLRWSATINGGFNSSESLSGNTGGAATRFNNWFGGASFSRPLGRELMISMTYRYQSQEANGTCPVISCGITPNRQAVFTRLQWHPWPARLR